MHQQRLLALDAMRGLAMLPVCVWHFMDVYLYSPRIAPVDMWWVDWVAVVCRSTAPIFIMTSGIILGYQLETRGPQFSTFRIHLLDRALFLAVIGHLLIALCVAARSGFVKAITSSYITDTVALCVILGALIAPTVNWRLRLFFGAGMALGNWVTWLWWTPSDPLLRSIREVVVGPVSSDDIFFWFPLLPWLGIYVAGSGVGTFMAQHRSNNLPWLRKKFFAVALSMIAVAVAVKASALLWTSVNGIALPMMIYYNVSPFQKYPPGPLYLLLYGGVALLLLTFMLARSHGAVVSPVIRLIEPIGQNSLPVFIAQYFLYYSLLYWLVNSNVPAAATLTAVFLPVSLVGVWAFASLCQRSGVARYLTVGLPRIMRHRKQIS